MLWFSSLLWCYFSLKRQALPPWVIEGARRKEGWDLQNLEGCFIWLGEKLTILGGRVSGKYVPLILGNCPHSTTSTQGASGSGAQVARTGGFRDTWEKLGSTEPGAGAPGASEIHLRKSSGRVNCKTSQVSHHRVGWEDCKPQVRKE